MSDDFTSLQLGDPAYDRAEQLIYEIIEQAQHAIEHVQHVQYECYQEMFGWAPGETPETLPPPPETPVVLDEDISDPAEQLPGVESYFDPEPYIDLDLVHPHLRDPAMWSGLLGWGLYDLDSDLGLNAVPHYTNITPELDEGIYEWVTDKMDGKDRIRADGSWTRHSHAYIGIYNHWVKDGTIDRVVSETIREDTNRLHNTGAAVQYLKNRLDELLADNDGSLDLYFLQYQMDRATMVDE